MLPLAALGIFLWVLLLLWRYRTTAVSMPVKEDEAAPHSAEAAAAAARGAVPAAYSSPDTETSDSDTQQSSPEVNSEKPPLPPTAEKPARGRAPMLSSGPEARERLKFILGASEEYSSDEEHVAPRPPSGVSQPAAANHRASAQSQPSPTRIK